MDDGYHFQMKKYIEGVCHDGLDNLSWLVFLATEYSGAILWGLFVIHSFGFFFFG